VAASGERTGRVAVAAGRLGCGQEPVVGWPAFYGNQRPDRGALMERSVDKKTRSRRRQGTEERYGSRKGITAERDNRRRVRRSKSKAKCVHGG